MPTPTYTLIQEQVLASPAASVTFSAIPGTYKDLVLEMTIWASGGGGSSLTFNSDTGTNYSLTQMYGDGTSAVSNRSSSATNIGIGGTGQGNVSLQMVQIMSYANTAFYKTSLVRVSASTNAVAAQVALWRSTAAITSLSVAQVGSFAANSTFRLWGVFG